MTDFSILFLCGLTFITLIYLQTRQELTQAIDLIERLREELRKHQ